MTKQPNSRKKLLINLFWVGLAIVAFVLFAPIGYRACYKLYHANDLPKESLFEPTPIWYTEDNLPDHPAINVIEDNPDYDEYQFLKVYDVTPDENGHEPEEPECMSIYGFTPEINHEYEVQIYCRNGADPIYNTDLYGAAENVRMQVYLPHKYAHLTRARKFGDYYVIADWITVDIAADNIFPVAAHNAIRITSTEDMRFNYVDGSAICYDHEHPDGWEVNPEWLFSPGGALIDTYLLGGREYACRVEFRFQVLATTWYPWDALIYDFQK